MVNQYSSTKPDLVYFYVHSLHEWTYQEDIQPFDDYYRVRARYGMLRCQRFESLIASYCAHWKLNRDEVKFMFEGREVKENMAPIDLQLQDDDCIEVILDAV